MTLRALTLDPAASRACARRRAVHSALPSARSMNPLGYQNRNRKLPVLLAALVLLQSLIGIPELSADASGNSAADPHHASFFIDVDPGPDSAGNADEADECRPSSDPAECDH